MDQIKLPGRFQPVGDGSRLSSSTEMYQEELQLATRNRGMPLEALRYDITPAGMHFLLVHYDIPEIDERSWRLTVAGEVENPLTLTLEDIKSRPRISIPVTMECAGNG